MTVRCAQPVRPGAPYDVLILAGDRPGGSELLDQAAVPGKALVPLGGLPVLERVLKVVVGWAQCRSVLLVAPNEPPYEALVKRCLPLDSVTWINPQPTLFQSIDTALNLGECWGPSGVIISGDHGLVTEHWLDRVTESLEGRADLAIGVADWEDVMAAFPNNRRTRYRFYDRSICGGNVFAFRREAMSRVLGVWQSVEAQRKRPWRVLSVLGYSFVMKYLLGQLGMEDAFGRLSELAKAQVVPTLIDDPAVAVDIDSVSDWALAEEIFQARVKASEGSQRC